ncbi:MAG: dipeptide ABC transporter ATP-binding protein [Methyloligellaceae bacterium]
MTDQIEPLLQIDGLCLSYMTRMGEVPAVVDFSLQLNAGESVGLVGESGCGKSTVALGLLRHLGRNGAITGGTVRFDGRDLGSLGAEELRRVRGGEIAMVYQEPMAALNPSMTVEAQLVEGPMVHAGLARQEARERARAMLDDVHLPDPERIMAAYPHQLSGGQQQRVVIAMALLTRPKLLLLDEPTTALDVTVEAGIVELIGELARKFGTALLYISHNLGLMLKVCDRIAVMYSGQVVEEGDVGSIFARPRHPYTSGLFGCIPLPQADKTARPLRAIPGQLPAPRERPPGCTFGPRCDFFEGGRCDAGAIATEAVGDGADPGHMVRCVRLRDIDPTSTVAAHASVPPAPIGETVLEVEDLRKYHRVRDTSLAAWLAGDAVKLVKANDGLGFTARRGETVAIVGESGCGKSTVARVLLGLETATGGTVRLDGEDIAARPVEARPPEQVRRLQIVFQNPDATLNPSHSVGAQIGRVIRKLGVEVDRRRVRERGLALLDKVKLPRDVADRRPRQLSGGQKQRIAIARAFAGEPAMVVADEPVSALDVSVAAAVTELLLDIQRENGTTLIFISHDLGVVRYLADRVVVMYLGQIMERGTTAQIFAPPYRPYTEALLAAVPIADPHARQRKIVLEGTVPSALDPPKGCPFASRCPRKLGAICDEERPAPMRGDAGHTIACHIPTAELARVEPVIETVAG